MAKVIICVRNRSHGTTYPANLAHAPRHHKSRPSLGQGSEVRLDARVRKRRVSTIKSVDGSRGDVFVAPGRFYVWPRCRSVSAF